MAYAYLLFVVILFFYCAVEAQYTPVSSDMHSFSSAIKGGKIDPSKEKVLYNRSTGIPGVVTEQWFTGGRGYSLCKLSVLREIVI